MVYDELIGRLTRMTPREIFEYETPSISSARDVYFPKGLIPRDVRIAAGLIIGPEDYNPTRIYLRNHIPKALKLKETKTLTDRVREFIGI